MTDLMLRPMSADDRAYIAKTWVESNARTELAEFLKVGGLYRQRWNRIVDSLLDAAHVRVAEREGVIVGFLCWELAGEGVVVHYVFTRLTHEREGIARRLLAELPGGPVTYTHEPADPTLPVPDGWRYSIAPLTRALRARGAAA